MYWPGLNSTNSLGKCSEEGCSNPADSVFFGFIGAEKPKPYCRKHSPLKTQPEWELIEARNEIARLKERIAELEEEAKDA